MSIVFLLFIALLTSNTFCFSPQGHEVIEARAYLDLLHNENITDTISGKLIVGVLIAEGILHTPDQWLDNSKTIVSTNDLLDQYPVLGSGLPDLVIPRQLNSFGQCFHYMATPDDAITNKDTSGVPVGMKHDAYFRCNEMITTLTNSILNNRTKSHEEFENSYAVMHIIADSYSRAHTERDSNNNITLLKPWRLVAPPTYIMNPQGWQEFHTENHHEVFDPRDEDFLIHDPTQGCANTAVPYLVPSYCLSKDGNNAKEAIKHYLITLWKLSQLSDFDKNIQDSTTKAYKIWKSDFLVPYFSHKQFDLTLQEQGQIKNWPIKLNTIVGYKRFIAGNSISIDTYLLFNAMLPLELGLSFDFVIVNDEVERITSYYPTLRLPIFYAMSAVIKPFRSYSEPGSHGFFHTVSFDFYYNYLNLNLSKNFGDVPNNYEWSLGVGIGVPWNIGDLNPAGDSYLYSDCRIEGGCNEKQFEKWYLPEIKSGKPEFVFDPDYLSIRTYIGNNEPLIADFVTSLGITQQQWKQRVGLHLALETGVAIRNRTLKGIASPVMGYYLSSREIMFGIRPAHFIYTIEDQKVVSKEAWVELKVHQFQKLNFSLEIPLWSYDTEKIILNHGIAIRVKVPYGFLQ